MFHVFLQLNIPRINWVNFLKCSFYSKPWRYRREVEVQLYSFFNFGFGWSGWLTPHSGRFTLQERDFVPIIQEVVWAPGPVWLNAINLADHRDSILGQSIRYRIAILITLSRSKVRVYYICTNPYGVGKVTQVVANLQSGFQILFLMKASRCAAIQLTLHSIRQHSLFYS